MLIPFKEIVLCRMPNIASTDFTHETAFPIHQVEPHGGIHTYPLSMVETHSPQLK